MNAPAQLSFRSRKILYAVITEYISTGEPVGSRKLARRYGLNLSPATIRNVLSDLEDAGLLTQPHTSAGRIPTHSGFRLFVDALVQMREIAAEDREAIAHRMRSLGGPPQEIIRETGRLLASLTGTASIVAPAKPAEEPLHELRFVSLPSNQLLAVLVTASGVVQNRVLSFDREIDASTLERVHNYLRDIVENRSLKQIRETLATHLQDERGQYKELAEAASALLTATLDNKGPPNLVIEGQDLLFDRPEFDSGEKIRTYLRAFEDRELLLEILDQTMLVGGVQVLIGSETNLADMEDVSLITASYRHGENSTGTVGVIGPSRMDYGKIVPLVEFTAQTMGELLGGAATDEKT
ncbi:MAG: heat-inducible transcriptional repressor HrcA [Myxococcota bacterium]